MDPWICYTKPQFDFIWLTLRWKLNVWPKCGTLSIMKGQKLENADHKLILPQSPAFFGGSSYIPAALDKFTLSEISDMLI